MTKKQKISKKKGDGRNEITVFASSRLSLHYKQIICPDYILQYPVENIMEIPCIEKVVLNSSSKAVIYNRKAHLPALLALKVISGQRSKNTWSRKSIAAFKLREKNLLGCKVTLRAVSMYIFLEKLMMDVLPRVKLHQEYTKDKYNEDLDSYLDKDGNYNVGVSDPFFFRELETHFESFKSLSGLNITVVTSTPRVDKVTLIFNGLQIPLS